MPHGPRLHHFWHCPLALGLREHLAGLMGAPPGSLLAALTRPHLWTAHPPPGLHTLVWDVVCLAALSALERGRQQLYQARAADGRAPAPAVARALVAVIAEFWDRLHSFASLGLPPRGWSAVPLVHPFLCRSAAGVVVLVPPPQPLIASPAASDSDTE
jgi:hypothetical protein